MRRRDEFITVINTFKTVSPTITDEQRIGLLRQAVGFTFIVELNDPG